MDYPYEEGEQLLEQLRCPTLERLVQRVRDLGLSTGHATNLEELLDEVLDQIPPLQLANADLKSACELYKATLSIYKLSAHPGESY